MSIDIFVQDMVHGTVHRVDGPAGDTLSESVLQAPVGSMLRGIHQYADTMFNSYQLRFFLDELAATAPADDAQREMITTLRDVAEQAIRINGYLWFSGD
ncbi:hypothetical protein AB0H71_12425 [Nocardia sp. NPDC050697]|uniref:hypothetical protein n=1 Tax=Nocardia sp. NPDC050697 TaxID=3155158 RepID=UPI0033C26248